MDEVREEPKLHGILDYIYRFFPAWTSLLKPDQTSTEPVAMVNNDTESMIFFENVKRLLLHDQNAYTSSSRSVGITLPRWVDQPQFCKIVDVLPILGKRIYSLDYAPAAAFTAYGFPLCPWDSEWLPCPAPGRVMTLEYTSDALTAALTPTPHLWWFQNTLIYSTNMTLGHDSSHEAFHGDKSAIHEDMTQWINDFIDSAQPDKIILLGRLTGSPSFEEALRRSKAPPMIVPNRLNLPIEDTVAVGIAKMVKWKLEDQGSDCFEADECERIREKADAIAGSPPSRQHDDEDWRTEL